ncbi:MAG: hypothetical protein HOA11_03515, partial [Euryarchaeota archaeon]|nr:hypothetical protein [Euryarchaeota archaeon]
MEEQNLIPFDFGNTFKSWFHSLLFMHRRSLAAFLLTGILLLSGCFGGVEVNEDETLDSEDLVKTVQLSVEWGVNPDTKMLDGTSVVFSIIVDSEGDDWTAEPTIITPKISLFESYEWESNPLGFQLSFIPEELGDYALQVKFVPTNGAIFVEPQPNVLFHTITIIPPIEDAPVLSAPVIIPLEEPSIIWFEGSVAHNSLSTCSLAVNYGFEQSKSANVLDDGTWKVLLDFSEISESITIETVVECGEFDPKSDTFST